MSALVTAALSAVAAFSYVEAGRARLSGWALWNPDEAAKLFSDLAEGRRRARLHAAIVILTWPVTLQHLPTAPAMSRILSRRAAWKLALWGVWDATPLRDGRD